MKSPIPYTYDLNTKSAQKVICVTHTDDNSVDVIQLHVVQNGALIDFSGNTIIARMVMSRTHELLSDNVVCEIDEATKDIMIPIDRKAISTRKGLMLVEVSVRGVLPQKLTFQFPLLVRVNGSILDGAEITPESQGTIPELLIAAAEELRRVQGFITSDDVYDILDSTLQGAQSVAPSLYVKRKGDNYALVYEDSEDVLHELFDFANLPSGTSDSYVTPQQYGAKGDGVTDDTAAINACLAENEIVLFSGIYLVNPTANQLENSNYRYGISVPSNRIIFFEKNAELICKETGENYYYTVLLHEASNVLIDGMTLHGNRATEQSITSPRATCHGLEILGCENIQIKNTSVDKFIGDGLGVWVSGSEGTEGEYTICRDIEMSNCAVFENRRNGITIGGVEGFRAVACKIYNNGTPVEYGGADSGSAQPPQAGVDIEPNYSHVPVKNLTFEDCLFYGNGGFDFINQNGTQERLSLINCDCLGGDGLYQGNVGALFRASDVTVTGGHYRRIGIGSNVTAAVISGAYINEILSAVTKKGAAFFDSCIIDGLLNSGGAERTIKTNSENNMAAICELKNCTIKNCLPNTGYSLGTISLEGCYVEQPEGQWLNNGHLDAKNTKFHFENNTTANVIWAKTNEFINCDFYYNEGRNYFIHTDDSATSKLWYNNRFYNDIYTLSPKANRLIKNWFNFASNKISGTATGEQIGNIFTDKKGITAYEIAVENGYSGTESQWLASLKGATGADGFSPTATVTQTASGATVTITDKNGTTTANISNGAPGQDYVLTAQDKSDIADIVLSELPTTQGVLYGDASN